MLRELRQVAVSLDRLIDAVETAPSDAALSRELERGVEGTQRITDAAARHGVHRIVFASSSSVYGANTKVPFHEDDRVDELLERLREDQEIEGAYVKPPDAMP